MRLSFTNRVRALKAKITSLRIEEMKLVRSMMRRAWCWCSRTRGLVVVGEEALKGVADDGGRRGEIGFKREFGKDGFKLVDGSRASEDAGMSIRKMMADASESLV